MTPIPDQASVTRSRLGSVLGAALAVTVIGSVLVLFVRDGDSGAVAGPPFTDAEAAATAQAMAFGRVPWSEYRAMFSDEARIGTLGIGQLDDAEWEERYRFSVGYGSVMEIVSCSSDAPDAAQCTVDIANEVLRRLGELPQRVTIRVSLAGDGTISSVDQSESTNNRYEAWRQWAMRNLGLESPWSDPNARITADPEKEAARAVEAVDRFLAEEGTLP